MKKSISKIILILLVAFFLGRLYVPALAQTPTPQDELKAKIIERAQQDAKNGKEPETTEGLSLLFGKDAEAVGMPMLEVVQIYEAAYDKAIPEKSVWDQLVPDQARGGLVPTLIFTIVLLVSYILKDPIISRLNNLGDSGIQFLVKKLHSKRFARRLALKRYKSALAKKHKQISIPFRRDRPLSMDKFYVSPNLRPVHSSKTISDSSETISEQKAIQSFPRLMITGAPGSGKSMILKKILLSFAKDFTLNKLHQNRIPVLLELNRLSEDDKSIFDHFVEILRRDDFPRAEKFLEAQLEKGDLMLLFDGLDEVATAKRSRVVKDIKDFLDQYDSCRAIITCRTAVYNHEFIDFVDQTCELTEFSDQQIRQYLTAWENDMPAGKSIEALMRSLHDRPLIMALARNPLLLTIISYLYTDEAFALPHSRAEFYKQSTNILLDQWKIDQNHYKVSEKSLVLQRLAKFNQDKGSAENQNDRRSIDVVKVLAETKKVLPDLNREDKDALPLLDEIEKRSGLLISIDGGHKYQFAHLTLQEYFAALALPREEDLLSRFAQDPDAWRETVKLWCGGERDSTSLIAEIFKRDPVTAFECLADAQQVSSALTNEISEKFKVEIRKEMDVNSPILRAFAAVAADQRPRGRDMLSFLEDLLINGEACARRNATRALSLTNQPRAAEILARYVDKYEEAKTGLLSMGDLAVPELSKIVLNGHSEVIAHIYSIKTPSAAHALVQLLWNADEGIALSAAYHLSRLLPSPGVEDRLRRSQLAHVQKNTQFLWVWEPFEEDDKSPLRIITSQVALLLDQGISANKITDFSEVDPRILIPLHLHAQLKSNFKLWDITRKFPPDEIAARINAILHTLKKPDAKSMDETTGTGKENFLRRLLFSIRFKIVEAWKSYLQILTGNSERAGDIKSKDAQERYLAIRHVLNLLINADHNMHSNLLELRNSFIEAAMAYWNYGVPMNYFNFWADGKRFEVFRRLLGEPPPTREDWRNIFKPVKYQFRASRHFWISAVVILLISVTVAYGLLMHFETVTARMVSLLDRPSVRFLHDLIVGDRGMAFIFFIGFPMLYLGFVVASYLSTNPNSANQIGFAKLTFFGTVYFFSDISSTYRALLEISENRIVRLLYGLFGTLLLVMIGLVSLSLWVIFYAALSIYLPWQITLGLILVLAGILFYSLQIGERKDREARNPLQGVLLMFDKIMSVKSA